MQHRHIQKNAFGSPHVLDLSHAQTPRERRAALRPRPRVPDIKLRVRTAHEAVVPSIVSERKEHRNTFGLAHRAVALLLLFVLHLTTTAALKPTASFYSDPEEVNGTLAAGVLDFELEATPFDQYATTSEEFSGDWNIDVLPHELSNPFYYYASSTEFSGDLELCSALMVDAFLGGDLVYSGPLTGLKTGTTTIIDVWHFSFDDGTAFFGKTCNFGVDFNGRQTRHNPETGGYSDHETVYHSIHIPGVLIAKVDLNVDTHAQWIELYNATDEAVDLSDWQICNHGACDVFGTTTPLAPTSYAMVVPNGFDVPERFIPDDVLMIELSDTSLGAGLNPHADMLSLVTEAGVVSDVLNWGVPDAAWPYYSMSLWDPGIASTTDGIALARIPVDSDTDMPDDFEVRRFPEVLLIEPNDSTLWHKGEAVTIRWGAENMNSDDPLTIDLYYEDGSGVRLPIVLGTENDGFYDWVVPDDCAGNIRIELVATGPENPLLNTRSVRDVDIAQCTDESCGGNVTVVNENISTTTNTVVVTSNTGGNSTRSGAGGDGGTAVVRTTRGDRSSERGTSTEVVVSSDTSSSTATSSAVGGAGGAGGESGTVTTGHASSSATVTEEVNTNTTSIEECDCEATTAEEETSTDEVEVQEVEVQKETEAEPTLSEEAPLDESGGAGSEEHAPPEEGSPVTREEPPSEVTG